MTTKNGSAAGATLSSQIDRLNELLDGLSEGLNQCVADAVKAAVREAAREAAPEALREALGEALGEALEEHGHSLRRLLARHEGRTARQEQGRPWAGGLAWASCQMVLLAAPSAQALVWAWRNLLAAQQWLAQLLAKWLELLAAWPWLSAPALGLALLAALLAAALACGEGTDAAHGNVG